MTGLNKGGPYPDMRMLGQDVLAKGYEFPWEVAELSLAETVARIERSVAEHVATSPHVRDFLESLSKGPGTTCPDSPIDELVKYASVRRGDIDQSDPLVNVGFMRGVVFPVFRFQADQMTNIFFHSELPDWGLIAFDAALTVDYLWMEWFLDVCVPYQQLDEEGRAAYRKQAESVLAEFDYTVFDYVGGEFVNRRTWAEAYPKLVTMFTRRLREMAKLCDNEPNKQYFLRLAEAYECTEIDQLEERWAAVDRAWIAIPPECQVFAVHGLENGYEHPRCISPEMRVAVRATQDWAREMIEAYRSSTPEYAERAGLGDELIDAIRNKLSRIDIGVFVSLLEAGTSMNFRYTGQVAPNRQDILAEGGKIFLAESSVEVNVRLLHEKVDRHCTLETAILLNPRITTSSGTEHTVFHELFHPVGCTREVVERLATAKDLLEEAKASVGGMCVCDMMDPSPEKRFEVISTALARVIRFMAKSELENETFAAYVRENLVVANQMLKCGLITLTPDGIELDPDEDKYEAFFQSIRSFIDDNILQFYGRVDRDMLEVLSKAWCDRSSETNSRLAEIIEWVNRENA